MEFNLTTVLIAGFVLLMLIASVVGSGQKRSKLERLRDSKVVRVSNSKHQYGIPLKIYQEGATKVEVIFPILEKKNWFSEEKVVKLISSTHELLNVEPIGKQDRSNVDSCHVWETYPLIKNYFDADPELAKFRKKREELTKIIKLTNTSVVYASRVESYTKILSDLDNAMLGAVELKSKCLSLIREILIGSEVAKLDVHEHSGRDAAIEFQIQQINQDFNNFKTDAEASIEAYTEVLKLSDGVLS